MSETLETIRALSDSDKLRIARFELDAALTWIEHWQRDVEANLSPTKTSLATAAFNIRNTLQEIQS